MNLHKKKYDGGVGGKARSVGRTRRHLLRVDEVPLYLLLKRTSY